MAMEIWYHLPGGPTDPSMLLSDLITEEDDIVSDEEETATARPEEARD